MTKWAMYFILAISISVGSAVASKPGQDDVEYEMGKVVLKGYVPSTPFIPPLYVPSPKETQSAQAFWSQASKMYYDEEEDLCYFLLKKPQSLVVFGKLLLAESEPTPFKIGEILLPQDDEQEEKEFIKVFNKIKSEGSVVHLTPDNVEFYQKISYSVPDLTLVQGMSIGVMRKFEGQEDCNLPGQIKFHEELSVISH